MQPPDQRSVFVSKSDRVHIVTLFYIQRTLRIYWREDPREQRSRAEGAESGWDVATNDCMGVVFLRAFFSSAHLLCYGQPYRYRTLTLTVMFVRIV